MQFTAWCGGSDRRGRIARRVNAGYALALNTPLPPFSGRPRGDADPGARTLMLKEFQERLSVDLRSSMTRVDER